MINNFYSEDRNGNTLINIMSCKTEYNKAKTTIYLN